MLVTDFRTTGNFEITIMNNGKLIHSHQQGKGHCESNEERRHVVAAIKEAYQAEHIPIPEPDEKALKVSAEMDNECIIS